ncbi:protein FAR1-RELATED SEQUENCE 4-like [Juglans regia]|uniref:Protein FAR1-RELATED SEQUENCE 4-like n=1 Tax=Juglans regia TaxID=51240 RepID=A0A6P9DT16_JUGRE|nr:protein FAR1-RELATED SEQUENCE 4-like [Juglans regia]
MGNGKEQLTTQTLSNSNFSSKNASYPFQHIMESPTPISNTSSATTRIVGSKDYRPDGGETEVPYGSPRVEECTEDRPNPTESDYGKYGKKCGFGVMTKWTERGEDEFVRYVTLACARGGKARNRTLNVANPRPIGKTECKAKLNAIRSFVVGAGEFENLPFLENYCSNYIDKTKHLQLGTGGTGALREYFLRMQYKNLEFFYMMDIDDDKRLKNVFWANPRSRAAYQYFDDVVTFDTTYLTNQYGMPFAPFVGVNDHGQSILLGAGLISSENTDTFVRLFETWLQCMNGIAPKSIITDQDKAMKNAIAIVFPKTRHKFCLWHILKKVPEKLGSYSSYKTGMKNALMKCVYDTQLVDEFEKLGSVD